MDLGKRAARASAWVVAGYGTSQALRLATNLIMTRLLVPETFGLMAIVTAIFVGLGMMSDLGIRGSVVYHKRGEDSTFLRTAWSLQIIRGILVWAMALLAAALLFWLSSRELLPAGTLYAEPLMAKVIAVSTFASVLLGFESINLHVASRNLALGRLAILEIVGQAAAVPVMVIWALQDPSVWALVAGGLTSSVVRTVGSHVFIPGPRCRLGWDAASFWEMFNFGKWILLASAMGFIVQHGDRLLIGGLLASREMGFYAIAILLAESARNIYPRILGSVLFPAVSEAARESTTRLSDVYYKFRTRADPVLFFASGLITALGDDVVRILYDDRYMEAGWMLQILSVSIFFGTFLSQNSVLLALGKSRTHAVITTTGGILLLISIPLLFHYFGTLGAVLASSIRLLWGVPVGMWAMHKLGILRPAREFLFMPLFFVGAAAGLAISGLLP